VGARRGGGGSQHNVRTVNRLAMDSPIVAACFACFATPPRWLWRGLRLFQLMLLTLQVWHKI